MVEKIIKIFLSYNNKDYDLAKEIKELLENCGLEVFLAHTSIEPTKEWIKEIHKNLKECNIFIPILTENFKDSKWTDQESGIAFNENKKILSLKIDIDPYGFLGQFQALNFQIKEMSDLTKFEKELEIVEKLMIHFPDEIRERFISSLEKTNCYRLGTAKCRFIKKLEKFKPFDNKEINEIIKSIANNHELYNAHEVKPYVKELMEKYDQEIKPMIKEEILDIFDPKRVINRILFQEEEEQRRILGGRSLHSSFLEEKPVEQENGSSLIDGLKKHL